MWPLGCLFFFGNTVQGKFLLAELSMTILSLVGEMKEKKKKRNVDEQFKTSDHRDNECRQTPSEYVKNVSYR